MVNQALVQWRDTSESNMPLLIEATFYNGISYLHCERFQKLHNSLAREAAYDKRALFQNGNVRERHFRKVYHRRELSSTIKVIKANCEAEET